MGQFKVLILGAGLCGPVLANGLLEAGIDVQVFEKLSKDAKRDGFQLRVARPGLDAFQVCLDKERDARIRQRLGGFAGQKETAPIWYHSDFRPLFNFSRYHVNYIGSAPMDRVVLRNILMERPLEAGIAQHNKSFVRYEILNAGEENEGVRAYFDDGSHADGDILIVADGAHSKANEQIGLKNLEYIKYKVMVAKGDLPMSSLRKLPAESRRSPTVVFAENRSLFSVAYMPNMTNDDLDDPKFDEQISSFTLGFVAGEELVPKDINTRSTAEQWEVILSQIKHWDPKFTDIANVIKGQPLYCYTPRIAERPRKDWRSKVRVPQDPARGHPRIWILGDAFHAMLPNRGMGGNQAMFDAAKALPLLKRLHDFADAHGRATTKEIATACDEFESEMIPRAFHWVEDSGGRIGVPIDSAKISGWLILYAMNVSIVLRDAWLTIKSFLTGTQKPKYH